MKKSIFILLIILLIKSNLSAQTITLSPSFQGYYAFDHEIVFISDTNYPVATISGEIESAISISIIPSLNNSIIIKDLETVSSVTNSILTGKGTVIRPRPGIICPCRFSTPIISKTDVVLSQTNNEIQITSNEELIISYELYDLLGKVIISEKTYPTNNFKISTSELTKAVYILKINLENQQYKTIKFIKN